MKSPKIRVLDYFGKADFKANLFIEIRDGTTNLLVFFKWNWFFSFSVPAYFKKPGWNLKRVWYADIMTIKALVEIFGVKSFTKETGGKLLLGRFNNFLKISLDKKKSVVYLHSNNAERY